MSMEGMPSNSLSLGTVSVPDVLAPSAMCHDLTSAADWSPVVKV